MGIKIIDVKVVGICSKCRKEGDKIPKYKDGTIIPDKDISCLSEAFGSHKHLKNKIEEIYYKRRDIIQKLEFLNYTRKEENEIEILKLTQELIKTTENIK